MDSPSGKTLVAVLAAVGASIGAAAAVVWHVATADGSQDFGGNYLRPSWFPATLYLVAAGLAVGLVAASFLVDSGVRIVQDRQRSRVHLFVLLIVIGAALGVGCALAWTHWPPKPVEVHGSIRFVDSSVFEGDGFELVVPQTGPGFATGGISGGSVVSIAWDDPVITDDASPFTPTIGNPWCVFPIGGVSVAAVAAFSLSLRDFRLTVVSRSESD